MTEIDIRLQVALISAAAILGAAVFALIAAIINASVQRRNVERQSEIATRIKRAEFRQAWINNLREYFVELQTKLAGKPAQPNEEITRDLFRILLGSGLIKPMAVAWNRKVQGKKRGRRIVVLLGN